MTIADLSDEQQKNLEEIKDRLVDLYHPTAIYLFGSYAWGAPDADSDVDIAVIVEESDEKPYKRVQRGARALWSVKNAVDLIVYTSREFYSKTDHPSTLQYKIKNRGLRLYESA